MFWLKDEIKNINKFYKMAKRKIRNKNNKDQIEKYNVINLNWRMKLKNNKTFTKRSKREIKNTKNEDQIGEYIIL